MSVINFEKLDCLNILRRIEMEGSLAALSPREYELPGSWEAQNVHQNRRKREQGLPLGHKNKYLLEQNLTGEQKLLAAVLRQAYEDALDPRTSQKESLSSLRKDAIDYLFSSSTEPYSARWACEVLGLDQNWCINCLIRDTKCEESKALLILKKHRIKMGAPA